MKKVKSFWNAILHNWHIPFFIIVGLILIIYLRSYTSDFDAETFKYYIDNIHVELAGAFFDIVIFGIIFYSMQLLFQKKAKINQLKEQLDDFRDWDEKEAGYRVIGILKRLHKLGVENVDLSRCHFNEINIIGDAGRIFGFDFKKANLTDVTFINMKMNNIKFNNVFGNDVLDWADYGNDPRTMFINCNLRTPNFSNNTFTSFNFIETTFINAKFENVQFYASHFNECIFNNTSFENTTFLSSSFHNMDIATVMFSNITFKKCTFVNCIYKDLGKSVVFDDCKFEELVK
ncbi:pentapeptide repeat-containing protein [Sulfurimonas sp. NW15]|uniref:pentapeptide repeat-containing protein n=1 Tax=Sulfurimonas sp. NW15 TaxID=2922729 RepID=UPI003DA90D63